MLSLQATTVYDYRVNEEMYLAWESQGKVISDERELLDKFCWLENVFGFNLF